MFQLFVRLMHAARSRASRSGGVSQNRQATGSDRRALGFSLVELVVVILILGILAAVAVLVLVVLGLPALQPPGSSVSGTASINGSLVIGVGLAGVLLLIYFLSRRK